MDVTRSGIFPVNVTKAERIKAVERVCKRLQLGEEEDKHTWELRERTGASANGLAVLEDRRTLSPRDGRSEVGR